MYEDYCMRTPVLEVTFLNSAAEGEEGLTEDAWSTNIHLPSDFV